MVCFPLQTVNGEWSSYNNWAAWDTCNVTCGGGFYSRYRNRTCTNPEPSYGGLNCTGDDVATETVHCNDHLCSSMCGFVH